MEAWTAVSAQEAVVLDGGEPRGWAGWLKWIPEFGHYYYLGEWGCDPGCPGRRGQSHRPKPDPFSYWKNVFSGVFGA